MTKKLLENKKEIEEENEIYKEVIRGLSEKYNIPTKEVIKIMKNKDKYKDIGRQRER